MRRSFHPGRRLAALAFRHEGLAWLLLLLLVTYSILQLGQFFPQTLPILDQDFGFRTALSRTHPVRQAYEKFEADFELKPTLSVYLHGPGVFGSEFFKGVESFVAKMQRRPDVYRVGSCLQLREPAAIGSEVRLRTILPASLIEDPPRLAARLRESPFTDRWLGFLYDRDKTVFVMTLVMAEPEGKPMESQALMESLREDLDRYAAEAGIEYHLNGLFFINQEILRTTFENQGRLTSISLVLILVMVWGLFGSFFFSVLSLILLGVSTLLVFTFMAHLGMPLNGLSGNLPSMILVIGLADLIHIAARYASGRHSYQPLGAAVRAMNSTFLPNLFTSLTTFGCLIVMASTRLEILSQFAISVCIGIFLVYLVTILYGPLVLRRAHLEPGRGIYFRLQEWIEGVFRRWGQDPSRDHRTIQRFHLLIVACLALSFSQRINSNWFRYFSDQQPVSQSLDFLEGKGFPVTGLEVEIPTNQNPYDLVMNEKLTDDVRTLTQHLEALPGVDGVFSFFTLGEQIRDGWKQVQLPEDLAPRWVEARRQSLFRQLVSFDTHDDFYSLKTRALRMVIATRLEDSSSLLDLGHRVLRVCHQVPLDGLDHTKIRAAGQMLYWAAIMEYVSSTFFLSLIGSVLVVFLCFLALTRDTYLAFLAVIPNTLPAFAMIASARILGHDLSENFCLLVSLSIGIAVDDTLHFLFHVKQAQDRGLTMDEAVTHSIHIVGAPIVMTSLILMAGFSVCLAGTIRPTINTGIFLNISIGMALISDLFLLPAMLRRYSSELETARKENQAKACQEVSDGAEVLRLLEELPREASLADHPVLDPGFLSAYFRAPPEGVRPAFLVQRGPRGELLGLTGFARFQVHLDCLSPPWVQRLAARLRQIWEGFFRIELLMFGLPAGLATTDTLLAPDLGEEARDQVRRHFVAHSEALLAEERATALVWKEFDTGEREVWDPILGARLGGFPSVPSVKQDLVAQSVESLESFRHRLRSGYRRQLDRNLIRGRKGGLEIHLGQAFAPEVKAWVPLFEQVLARSETRLETLGEEFFRALSQDRSYVLNTARVDQRLVGGALCRVVGKDLIFLYVGMDYVVGRDLDLYFNLLYSVLQFGLESGCTRIHWGQTSLDAKGRFGGKALPCWFYLRFRNRLLNWLVQLGSPLLFPLREQEARRVFKEGESP